MLRVLWLGVGRGDSQSDLSSSDDLAVVGGAAGSGRGRVRRRRRRDFLTLVFLVSDF